MLTDPQASTASTQPASCAGKESTADLLGRAPRGGRAGGLQTGPGEAFQFAIYKAGPRLGTGQGLAHRHTAGQRQAGPEPSPAGLELAEGPPNDSVLVNWPTLQGKNVRVSVQAQGTCLVWPRGGDLEQMSGGS